MRIDINKPEKFSLIFERITGFKLNLEITGIMIQVDPASYDIYVFGGMGVPAINFPNQPLMHMQINDGPGLIK